MKLTLHPLVRNAPADEKFRIRVILGCADGESGTRIAQRLKTSIQTLSKWWRRYEAYRFAGLSAHSTQDSYPFHAMAVSDSMAWRSGCGGRLEHRLFG